MDDDDGLMLNWGNNQPQKDSLSTGSKKIVERVGNSDKKQGTDVAKEATEGPLTNSKIRHGKAQVLSSLFSFNPEFKQAVKSCKAASRNEIPSNAPVADATQFTGMGIDPDLVDLLRSKLNVSAPTNVQRKAIPILLGPSRTVQECEIPDKDVDVVVQAETGSGKTLTYLLPVINRLVGASTTAGNEVGFGDRLVGTVAIVLTPTRELAQQVTSVLTTLVNLGRSKSSDVRRTHWIVPGIVIGGDNKAKEKARLRKGINVLVSTPGRLLDHLENTKSFNVRNLRWLVLDEADRLLDLGFEETLKKIMTILDERTRDGPSPTYSQALKSKFWPQRRQTILCSATLRDDVKHLAGWSLSSPTFISGTDQKENTGMNADDTTMDDIKFTTPNQLKQTYTITPAKLRLVTLTAMLKSCFLDKNRRLVKSKVIVFLSCCDSVDFHYALFGNAGKQTNEDDDDEDDENEAEGNAEAKAINKILGNLQAKKTKKEIQKEQQKQPPWQNSTVLGDVPVYRLHGDLDQQIRSLTFAEFSKASAGVLLCTDVAARGLDLPNVDRIIQYDPPTDMKDYVHRVGRTARLGKAGEAALFLLPSEMDYMTILKAQDLTAESLAVETVLGKLVVTPQGDYQIAAQEIQNKLENYVLSEEEHVLLARKAYWSSVRAYATHSAAEKHIFHVKKLHLGHLAKSFALREAPSNLHEFNRSKKKKESRHERQAGRNKGNNTLKRTLNPASEFAIISSADTMVAGPTTRKRRKHA